jgi:hypothetical protein
MKRIILQLVCGTMLVSQQVSAQATVATNNYATNYFLGYNTTNGTNPLLFKTNGGNRMKINGDISYTVDGYSAVRNGYMLLGVSNNSMLDGSNIYSQKGAFSLLHLNGSGASYQEFGYRPWMQTGITFTKNADLSYFGLRKLSTDANEEDITETTIFILLKIS